MLKKMAINRIMLLALAGAAFAQMDGMNADMNSSSSMMVTTTTDSSAAATTMTSSSMDSPIGLTNPATTTTNLVSGMPTSTADDMDYSSMSSDNYTDETTSAPVGPSMITSSSTMTDMSSMTETGSMTTMMGGMPS
ncbi:hypothetical protein F5Y19DRAFT_420709, partial [Xylariaceae sp. FL1651]